jgi:DNA invertase Pin-like site-specific DNA recombinase
MPREKKPDLQLVIGYIRVSTIEQEHGYGREAQEAAIQKFCTEKGFANPEFVRESASGESILKRTELRQVVARAKAASEDGIDVRIVVSSLDRLTRLLMDQEALVQQAVINGFRYHSANPSEDDTLDPSNTQDATRTLIRQIFGCLHQFERQTVKRRLDDGLKQKAKAGLFCGGRAPFGYDIHNKELVVNEYKAQAVRRVHQLRNKNYLYHVIVGICKNEYPEFYWTINKVRQIVLSEQLYRGYYKPRGGEETAHRPDLVILGDREESNKLDNCTPVERLQKINWEVFDDDKIIPMPSVSELLGQDIDIVRGFCYRLGIPARKVRSSSPEGITATNAKAIGDALLPLLMRGGAEEQEELAALKRLGRGEPDPVEQEQGKVSDSIDLDEPDLDLPPV